MQRPVMDPTFVLEQVEAKRRRIPLRKWIVLVAKWFWRGLLSNPLSVDRTDEGQRESTWTVLARVAVCWSIFLPALIGLTALLLVWVGTHPSAPAPLSDPAGQGCYFDPVNFVSTDGTPLTGWLVPAIDARRVLIEKDRTLRTRRPAIVLAHDYGRTPQQMLPLVRPLHEEGLVVFVVGLRGQGTGSVAGQTFGVNESKDVLAAVEVLRGSTLVDPDRIAVAGIGSGANAALIAASRDSRIKAVVLANPLNSCEAVVAAHIAPHGRWLGWMTPLCRHVFELVYGVEDGEIGYDHYASVLKSHPTLVFNTADSSVFDDRVAINRLTAFCRQTLHAQDIPAVTDAR